MCWPHYMRSSLLYKYIYLLSTYSCLWRRAAHNSRACSVLSARGLLFNRRTAHSWVEALHIAHNHMYHNIAPKHVVVGSWLWSLAARCPPPHLCTRMWRRRVELLFCWSQCLSIYWCIVKVDVILRRYAAFVCATAGVVIRGVSTPPHIISIVCARALARESQTVVGGQTRTVAHLVANLWRLWFSSSAHIVRLFFFFV